MIRRAFRFPLVPAAFILALAVFGPGRAAAQQADELPTDGHNALNDEFQGKWATVWSNLLTGQDTADPANTQHAQAIDAAARWATYRLTWGLEKEPGEFSKVTHDLTDNLQLIRAGKDKTQKLSEMYSKALIVHAQEVLQTRKPIARINAAMLLARLAHRSADETMDDVLHRLAGTNQADLADAFAATIKDPTQLDAARMWAFHGLQQLLALPQATPPALPRDKEEAALGEVLKFLQARNQPDLFPPGTPDDEIDGFRYVRREAIKAMAQCPFPTLSTLPDKPHLAWVLLKIVARDGVAPEPRLDERVEAAIGVAHAQPDLDKDYQPDYAAHQLGLLVVDFVRTYEEEKRTPDKPPTQAWKVEASRLIEALELMKAQTKNAHVAFVVDESLKLLTMIEKALPAPNATDLEQKLKGEAAPSKSLYQSIPGSTVTFGGKPPAPPDKPEEKKDK